MKMTAVKALSLGWSVIPIRLDKRPYFSWQRFQSTRPDKDMLSRWHTDLIPPAWAVVTGSVSGVVVLDFDGEYGAQTLESLGLQPHVKTGSGGHHVYVEHPGWPVKTLSGRSKRELGESYPGLDVRGDGGYAVFCGRNRVGRYEWLREPVPYPISSLSDDVQRRLGLAATPDVGLGPGLCADPTGLFHTALERSASGRNEAGFWLACQLRDSGMDWDEAKAVITTYQESVGGHNTKGQPEPYSVAEAMASLEQAYNAQRREPSGQIGLTIRRRVVDIPEQDDQDEPLTARAVWPAPMSAEAYHGLAGDFVRLVEPHTEADPAALLVSYLVLFGSVIGRGPHFAVEADRHYTNLFSVLVGLTSKGRKGTSLGQARRVVQDIDPIWSEERTMTGLSSGEGLIWAVRDPIEKLEPVRENRRVVAYETVVVDEGVSDKRLLVIEGEFASTLRVMGREGNTLSAVIRNAWDGGNLRVLTKSSPAHSTGAHISIIGHITKDELLRYLDSTEAGNGFGNRILWVCVRRSKSLPEGGHPDEDALSTHADNLRSAIDFARGTGEMRRDEHARELWHQVYPQLSEGRPGLLGAMIARAEAQVMRLACVYALLDGSETVKVDHLQAALALWDYCADSARFIFGDSLGDPVADELRRMLSEASDGLTRTDISRAFGRNKSASEIGHGLGVLMEHGLARSEQVSDARGRPAVRWMDASSTSASARARATKKTKETE